MQPQYKDIFAESDDEGKEEKKIKELQLEIQKLQAALAATKTPSAQHPHPEANGVHDSDEIGSGKPEKEDAPLTPTFSTVDPPVLQFSLDQLGVEATMSPPLGCELFLYSAFFSIHKAHLFFSSLFL